MKKVTKKNAIPFIKKVVELLNNKNAIEIDSYTSLRAFKINTNVGEWIVKFESIENLASSSLYTIFSCFEDEKKAIKEYPCSQFTGKFNFHNSDGAELLGNFEYYLNKLTK